MSIEYGPIYGVELLDRLPLDGGNVSGVAKPPRLKMKNN
jgi:hypothetical protein